MPKPPAAAQLTGLAGKVPQPQKAPHQGFPRALSDEASRCACRLFPPQYEPAVAACKNKLSTVITALHGNDFYPQVFTQGSQLTKIPLKVNFLPRSL